MGIVLKYLASSETSSIWPLNAFLLTIGWAIYSTAQSLVLYSRLHHVIRNQRIQRYVFLMILSTIFTFIIPTLVAVWPAFNTSDHEMSSVWSPRLAIMDRYTQIGYTITESTISGLYIWSLLRLLRLKTNVRQRCVMLDLIYVNVVVIAFDILEVVFVYTNQLGISHPIQSFSYILKLRLEFVVLNQLMAVAARGLRRQSFHVKRYHHPSTREGLSSYGPASQQTEISHLARKGNSPGDSAHIELPSSTYSPNSELDSNVLNHIGFAMQKSSIGYEEPLTQSSPLPPDFSEVPSQTLRKSSHQSPPPHISHLNLNVFRRGDQPSHGDQGDNTEDEKEEIDLHLWENNAAVVLEVPWFRTKVEA